MRKLDDLVASGLEQRLLDPERLEDVLGALLDRREERISRRRRRRRRTRQTSGGSHARLKRLYAAIERGLADLDVRPSDRIAELKATRDRRAMWSRAAGRRAGAQMARRSRLITVAVLPRPPGADCALSSATACDHLRPLAQRVQVAEGEVRLMASKTTLMRALAAIGGLKRRRAAFAFLFRYWRRGVSAIPMFLPSATVRENRVISGHF